MYSNNVEEVGKSPRTVSSLSSDQIVRHGKRFLIGDKIDEMDVMLNEIILVAINCGMRYEEVAKCMMRNVTCT